MRVLPRTCWNEAIWISIWQLDAWSVQPIFSAIKALSCLCVCIACAWKNSRIRCFAALYLCANRDFIKYCSILIVKADLVTPNYASFVDNDLFLFDIDVSNSIKSDRQVNGKGTQSYSKKYTEYDWSWLQTLFKFFGGSALWRKLNYCMKYIRLDVDPLGKIEILRFLKLLNFVNWLIEIVECV